MKFFAPFPFFKFFFFFIFSLLMEQVAILTYWQGWAKQRYILKSDFSKTWFKANAIVADASSLFDQRHLGDLQAVFTLQSQPIDSRGQSLSIHAKRVVAGRIGALSNRSHPGAVYIINLQGDARSCWQIKSNLCGKVERIRKILLQLNPFCRISRIQLDLSG